MCGAVPRATGILDLTNKPAKVFAANGSVRLHGFIFLEVRMVTGVFTEVHNSAVDVLALQIEGHTAFCVARSLLSRAPAVDSTASGQHVERLKRLTGSL